ncbi:MAG: glycosyltransferase [Pseudomonadota bacterium]
MRVMIVVTHLLGTGHLARALTLARAFVDGGHAVTLVSGGRPVPHLDTAGIRYVQLPSVASDGTDFSRLLTSDGTVADATHMAKRKTALLSIFGSTSADVLITELFPFGRRSLRDEFQALLHAAHGQCRIFASVRDILAPPSTARKAAFAEDMIAFYDGVLVHSDPNVITLDQSWPVSTELAAKLHYTGFVAPAPLHVTTQRNGPILVSAGGGVVGNAMFDAALKAAREMPDLEWLFCVTGENRRRSLKSHASQNVCVEGLRSDFRDLLIAARASVSMCGYNTALDVLQSGVPAVIIPFEEGGEEEQTLRARALADLPAMRVITNENLRADSLRAAVTDVMLEVRAPRITGMDGASETVQLVAKLMDANRVAH